MEYTLCPFFWMRYFVKLSLHFLIVSISFLIFVDKAFGQQYVQKFSHIAQITFPSKPHHKLNESDSLYSLKYNSDLYGLVIHSFRQDPDFTLDSGKLKNFYDDFLRQMIEADKVSLIYSKKVIINGLDGIEVKYTTNLKNKATKVETIYTCYHRIFYVNRTIYNYGFSTPNDSNKSTVDLKNNFINSLIITEKKENLYQYYEVEQDDSPGSRTFVSLIAHILVILMELAAIGLIAGLVIKGLIYLYRAIF